jgi:thiol-disulfide isomerase/thioredoxin
VRSTFLGPLVAAALFASGALSAACKRDPAPSASAAPSSTAPADSTSPLVLAPTHRLRWAEPPDATTDVAKVVREARAREAADGRALIVYVGATWCEPCQRFHHAVERGELDDAFPALTVLAFDAERDGEALASAGYVSRLIPLFALPAASGRDSGKRIEGSVKGEEAVSEITPRLRALLAGAVP